MGALTTGALSIANVLKTIDPNGDAAAIAEVLNQTNAILDDIPWEAGNLDDGNRTSVRTSLPTVSAAIANTGTSGTSSTSAQIDDACAIFRSKSEMDAIVAETGGLGMVPVNRANEARAHIESHGQKLSTTLFYGSPSVPEEFVGIANRLNSLSGVAADNVIDCSGTGSDNTSIYLVGWGKGKVMGIYPKGTKGGLERNDEGKVSITASTGIAGQTFPGYREYFTWRCGLAVQDWRYLVRACNIDISDLLANGGAAAPLVDIMISMLEAVPNPDGANLVFYMNRTVRKMLRIQIKDGVQAGGGLTYENYAGRRTLMFDGYPVRLVDKITNTETAVA